MQWLQQWDSCSLHEPSPMGNLNLLYFEDMAGYRGKHNAASLYMTWRRRRICSQQPKKKAQIHFTRIHHGKQPSWAERNPLYAMSCTRRVSSFHFIREREPFFKNLPGMEICWMVVKFIFYFVYILHALQRHSPVLLNPFTTKQQHSPR